MILSRRAFSLAAVLGLILVFSLVIGIGVRFASDSQRQTQQRSDEQLLEQKILAHLSSLKSTLASDLSRWVFEPYKSNYFTGSAGGTIIPVIENLDDFLFNFDPEDPHVTYEILCLSEGAGSAYLKDCQEQKGIGVGRIPQSPPPPASSHAFLPKVFKIRLLYRDPDKQVALEVNETWEFTSLRLNNFALVMTGQEGSQVLGPMTYGARVSMNILSTTEDPDPTLTLNNDQGPIRFQDVVTTNLAEDKWIIGNPSSLNPISYERGIAYDQASPISTEQLVQSFQVAAQNAGSFRRDLVTGSTLKFLSGCRVEVNQPGIGTATYDLLDNQFYVSPGRLSILHSNEKACKRVTIMAHEEIEVKGSIRALDDQTAIGLVALQGDIKITEDATALDGTPLMSFSTALAANDPGLPTSFQLDAALVAPNGQSPSLHSSYLDNPSSVGLGRLLQNGMAVAKNLSYFQEFTAGDINGFTTLTRNFNPRFLVRSQAPPGLDIETRQLQVQVLQSSFNRWDVQEVRSLLGL